MTSTLASESKNHNKQYIARGRQSPTRPSAKQIYTHITVELKILILLHKNEPISFPGDHVGLRIMKQKPRAKITHRQFPNSAILANQTFWPASWQITVEDEL